MPAGNPASGVHRRAQTFFDIQNEVDFSSWKRDSRIHNDEFLKNLSSGEPADTMLKPIGPEGDNPLLRSIHDLDRRMRQLEKFNTPR